MTVDKHTHELARPFLVVATQNPVEYEGTYPLPEAQLDRFMVRVSLGYPSAEAESEMLLDHAERDRVLDLEPVAEVAEVLAAQGAAAAVHGSEALRRYVVAILDATRADPRVDLGASPRAGLMLFRAAKAMAALDGRDHALPDDVQALADSVLAHRLLLGPGLGRRRARRGGPRRAGAGPGALDAMRPLAVAVFGWGCASLAATFDTASLYVPGVALMVIAGGALAWVALAGQRGGDRAPRRAAHRRRGGALPAAHRGPRRRAAAARRRADRAAARLAGADRRPLVAARAHQRALRAPRAARARAGPARDPRPAAPGRPRAGRRRDRRGARAAARRAGHRARRGGAGAGAHGGAGIDPGVMGRRLDASIAELEIDGLRPYREGTSASRIHWPTVARRGEMLERRLVAELDSAPLIVLDPSGRGRGGARQGGARGGVAVRAPRPRRRLRDPAAGRAPPGRDRPRPGRLAGVHARLALVESGPAAAAAVLGPRGGAVIWVTARRAPRRAARAGADAGRRAHRGLARPLPGGRPLFEVAGCTGCLVERARAGVAA